MGNTGNSIIAIFVIVIVVGSAVGLTMSAVLPATPEVSTAAVNYEPASTAAPTAMVQVEFPNGPVIVTVGQSITTQDNITFTYILGDTTEKIVVGQIAWASGQITPQTTMNKDYEFQLGDYSKFIVREQIDAQGQPVMVMEMWTK